MAPGRNIAWQENIWRIHSFHLAADFSKGSGVHMAAWVLPASGSGPWPNGYKMAGEHWGDHSAAAEWELCFRVETLVLVGQWSWWSQVGGRQRGQDAPLASGGIRSCGEEGSCGSGPRTTVALSWKAKAVLGEETGKEKGKGGEERHLELTP